LKPEQLGSQLIQEKCQEEKACDKGQHNNNNNNNKPIFWNMYTRRKTPETRNMKDSIAEKTKDSTGRGCMDNCHIT
jgi:hypothetical protein